LPSIRSQSAEQGEAILIWSSIESSFSGKCGATRVRVS
jgi:hypothetical protein